MFQLNKILNLYKTILCAVYLVAATGCIKDEMKKFVGDGSLIYIPKPGLLGVDGYTLRFPSFDISKPFSIQYDFINLPTRNDPYWIYFIPDENLDFLNFNDSQISISLSESDGKQIFSIKNYFSDWIEINQPVAPKTTMKKFRLSSSKKDLDSLSFLPEKDKKYTLKLAFVPSQQLINLKNYKGYFELKLTAGK